MRILFQGDSITDAGRKKDEAHPLGFGYAMLASSALGLQSPGKYEFINRGVGGDRITRLYARIKSDLINLSPDVMSILIGVNDVWHELKSNNGTATPKFLKIYRMLLEETLEALPQLKIMLFAPYVMRGSATEPFFEPFQSGVAEKAEAVRQIAAEFSLPYFTLQDKFDEAAKLAPPEYWLRDGVHPTLFGHQLIANEWLKAFQTL